MARAREVLEQAKDMTLIDENGRTRPLTLLPPLSDAEIASLESRLACSLPNEMRELLLYCQGFEGIIESVNFAGELEFEFEVFPHGLPIAHDGFGNFWIVDLTSDNAQETAVFFACHDPAVIVFQAPSVAHFIGEVLKLGNAPWKSEIDQVHEQYAIDIWNNNPKVLSREQAINSDFELKRFAESLDDSYEFIDLRTPKTGDGFSWGRYGAETVCKRSGGKRIFACQKRKLSWLQKMFGV